MRGRSTQSREVKCGMASPDRTGDVRVENWGGFLSLSSQAIKYSSFQKPCYVKKILHRSITNIYILRYQWHSLATQCSSWQNPFLLGKGNLSTTFFFLFLDEGYSDITLAICTKLQRKLVSWEAATR